MASFSLMRAYQGGYASREGVAQCEKHGEYPVKVFSEQPEGPELGCIPTRCQKCAAEEEAAEKVRESAARIAVAMKQAQIPVRFADAEFENFDVAAHAEAFAAVRDYAADIAGVKKAGRSLILVGEVGTGKTHLAIATLKRWLRAGQSGRYATVSELVREIRHTWRGHGDRSEKEMVEYFGSRDLLVLDEVGAQYGSEGERVILFDILNERYERMKPTMVLGNVTVDELKKYLDERSVDRLRENGGSAVIFRGKSYRKAA